jgi:hypothetical protein
MIPEDHEFEASLGHTESLRPARAIYHDYLKTMVLITRTIIIQIASFAKKRNLFPTVLGDGSS